MKRERIDLRVRTDEKQVWECAADQLGLNVSELIRRSVTDYLVARSDTLTWRGKTPPPWVVGTQERPA